MSKRALIIFVRKPERGKVKTRLAATLGDEAALFIYEKLLQHTLEITEAVDADKLVFYAGEIVESDLWQRQRYSKHHQADGDLGTRMKTAFEKAFNTGYEDVCIVGSDCFELTPQVIQEAFQALTNNDVVIGPAKDGGYYLLGMKNVHAALFENIAWSTSMVYKRTIDVLKKSHLSFFALPVLADVDEEEDLPEEWKAQIQQRKKTI